MVVTRKLLRSDSFNQFDLIRSGLSNTYKEDDSIQEYLVHKMSNLKAVSRNLDGRTLMVILTTMLLIRHSTAGRHQFGHILVKHDGLYQ